MMDQVPNTAVLLGLRLGWIAMPSVRPASRMQPQLEVEAEVKLAPAFTANGSTSPGEQSYFAPVFGWRAHAVASLRVTPWLRAHVLAGAGGESIASSSPYMADETDAMMYWGVGVRVAASELSNDWRLRVDARHGLTAGRVETFASTVELQLGIETSFGDAPTPRPARPRAEREHATTVSPQERCRRAITAGDSNNNCVAVTTDNVVAPPPVAATPLPADVRLSNDADQDQILDGDDKCPDAAETPNGFLDGDGCPDGLQPAPRAPSTVVFPRGSAKLGPVATRQLIELANVLREGTELKLSLLGHDAGGGKATAALRERRITSIKWYLIDQGIASERMTVSTESASAADQADRIELRISP